MITRLGRSKKETLSMKGLPSLANLVCITALLPYVSPFPLGTDVQLMGSITASAVLVVLMIVYPNICKIDRTDFIILLLGVISLLYFNWSLLGFGANIIRRTGHILIGFPIYYTIRRLYRYISPWAFVFVVALYLGVLIFQILAPAAYEIAASPFMSSVRSSGGDLVRGVAGLCQEPSQMAILALLFILNPIVFKPKYWVVHKALYRFVIFASLLMLILSRSATGIFLFIVLFLLRVFLSKRLLIWKAFALAGIFTIAILARNMELLETSPRWLDYLNNAAKNPVSAIQDDSLALRQIGLIIGIINLPRIPFGTGQLALDQNLLDRAWQSPWIDVFVGPGSKSFVYNYASGNIYVDPVSIGGFSEIGRGIYRMGLIYLVSIAFFLSIIKGNRNKWSFRILFFAMITNGALVMSAIWFMLGIFVDYKQRDKARFNEKVFKCREPMSAQCLMLPNIENVQL